MFALLRGYKDGATYYYSVHEYSEFGWHQTELMIKQQFIAQDELFCLAMRNAIDKGLERVSEKQ